MPKLSGPFIGPGQLDTVYSRTAIQVGSVVWDDEGNKYKFLRGVGSTVAGSWVVYDHNGDTELLAHGHRGPIAVAQAAIVANKWGWYCIDGITNALLIEGTGLSSFIGRSVADGYCGDAFNAGPAGESREIFGAIARSSVSESTIAKVQIYRPFIGRSTISRCIAVG